MDREERPFVEAHPRSRALFERARHSLLGGVPMNWMSKWPGPFPPFVAQLIGGFAPIFTNEQAQLLRRREPDT